MFVSYSNCVDINNVSSHHITFQKVSSKNLAVAEYRSDGTFAKTPVATMRSKSKSARTAARGRGHDRGQQQQQQQQQQLDQLTDCETNKRSVIGAGGDYNHHVTPGLPDHAPLTSAGHRKRLERIYGSKRLPGDAADEKVRRKLGQGRSMTSNGSKTYTQRLREMKLQRMKQEAALHSR